MPQNTQGTWVGKQALATPQAYQRAGTVGLPGAQTPTASAPTTAPQATGGSFGLNLGGGQPLFGNGVDLASLQSPGVQSTTGQSQTPAPPPGSGRDQLVKAILNESGTPTAPGSPPGLYGSAENSSVFDPTTNRRYEPYVHVSHIWAGGNQPGWLFDPGRKYGGIKNPGRFRPTPYAKPGQQGRLSIPFATMPDQYPEFRRDPGGVMGQR